MNGKLFALAALFLAGCAAHADQTMCFEADKWDEATRTDWSHQWYVADFGPLRKGPHKRPYRWLFGYGYNVAGDMVPFTGSAVKNDQDQWVVSILGTLHQHSTMGLHDSVPEVRYWIISQNWEMSPGKIVEGNSHNGNLIEPFGESFPVTHDDSYDSYIKRIPCEEIPQ